MCLFRNVSSKRSCFCFSFVDVLCPQSMFISFSSSVFSWSRRFLVDFLCCSFLLVVWVRTFFTVQLFSGAWILCLSVRALLVLVFLSFWCVCVCVFGLWFVSFGFLRHRENAFFTVFSSHAASSSSCLAARLSLRLFVLFGGGVSLVGFVWALTQERSTYFRPFLIIRVFGLKHALPPRKRFFLLVGRLQKKTSLGWKKGLFLVRCPRKRYKTWV